MSKKKKKSNFVYTAQKELDRLEVLLIKEALCKCGWAYGKTAKKLKIHRRTLEYKLKRLRLL